MKLLFRGHFLINAVDKVNAGHLMRWRKVFLPGNFLLSSLPSSLPLLLTLEHHKMPIVLTMLPFSVGEIFRVRLSPRVWVKQYNP